MHFTIIQKLNIGFGTMAACVLLVAFAGYFSARGVADSAEFIAGPAWDAADGAMETTIETEAQVIDVNRQMASLAAVANTDGLRESAAAADEAFTRMANSGLIPADALQQASELRDALHNAQQQALDTHSVYRQRFADARAVMQEFVDFMAGLEGMGDAQMDELATSTRPWDWTELEPRWEAADGTMEARIALLTQLFELQSRLLGAHAGGDASFDSSLEELASQGGRLASLPLLKNSQSDDGQSMSRRLLDLVQRQNAASAAVLKAHRDFRQAEEAFHSASRQLLGKLAEVEELGDSQVEEHVTDIDDTLNAGLRLLALVALVGLIVAGSGVVISIRSIGAPIRNAAMRLQDIAEGEGDLTAQLPVKGHDEMSQLAENFNRFVGKMRGLIQELRDAAQQVTRSAAELSEVTEQTSSHMLAQQHETDQVATAMNEMSASAQEVARNSQEAAHSANTAHDHSAQGQKVMEHNLNAISALASDVERAGEAMNRLQQDAESIGTILDVIRGIAEQTNLLALNAAIEAARAGEQGRGFAVVADEVRTLASRTQQSTQEIHEMIERLQSGASAAAGVMTQSQEKARDSLSGVREASSTLQEIDAAISAMNNVNMQIASGAEQQHAVVEEMNRSLISISELSGDTVQKTTAAATASEQLNGLAQGLDRLVTQFKV